MTVEDFSKNTFMLRNDLPQPIETLLCLESRTTTPARPYPAMRRLLHVHAYHEIFLCMRGGWQAIGESLRRVTPGEVYFIPAGMPHIATASPGTVCAAYILYLTEEYFSSFADGDRETRAMIQAMRRAAEIGTPCLRLSTAGTARAEAYMREMIEEIAARRPGHAAAVKGQAHLLVLTLFRECREPALSLDDAWAPGRSRLAEAISYIHTHYMERITVAEMLRLTHLRHSQFHARFKAETGMTLTAYVNALRLATAEGLLRDADLPITEIAYRCGYNSLSYFYRAFTARHGMAPQAYRARSREAPDA